MIEGTEHPSLTLLYHRPPGRTIELQSILLEGGSETLVVANRLTPKLDVEADGQLVIRSGDIGVWFLFQGEPFDLARVYSPQGEFRGFYVDALEPVSWTLNGSPTVQPLVDLFLDLWIWPTGRQVVLDRDELDQAKRAGWVTAEQAHSAREAIHCLQASVEAGAFPPDRVRDWTPPPSLFRSLAALT